eukprot:GHVO01005677.1.p1 GENE.GHVO01005677.1~~GHVO01005677.1.p1  ORF type:complete len:261 (+),score=33.35 GHVO01005677.1:689-1471(+)
MDTYKKRAAYAAVDEHVRSGMIVGLGTGSTAKHAVDRVGQKLKSGELRNIKAISTSDITTTLAKSLDIPLVSLDDLGSNLIDVTLDGADEIDLTTLHVIKGGGGALFREKLVESWSKKFILIVDQTKVLEGTWPGKLTDNPKKIGSTFKIPIEVPRSFVGNIRHRILAYAASVFESAEGIDVSLREQDQAPFTTPDGNYIIDLTIPHGLKNPKEFADNLLKIVGVIEHGLFLGLASACVICAESGVWECSNGTCRKLPEN